MLRQDLRYAIRSLRRSPAFTFTALVVVALGVSASTAAFSTLDYVLVRPLPFAEPDRLVKVWQNQESRGYSRMELSPANFRDWKAAAHSFDGFAAYQPVSANLLGRGDPLRVEGARVTPDLFALLGAHAAIGRTLTEGAARFDASAEVVISGSLWRSRFASDPAIAGHTVIVDDRPRTIAGVMPDDFAFPARTVDVWLPLRFAPADYDDRTDTYLRTVARLKPDATIEQARSELSVIAAGLVRAYPKENANTGATVVTMGDELPRQSRTLLIALAAASGCVLLIAITNLASLLLTRALSRQRELSIRAAIGAGRRRLVREMLTESLVLAIGGGALGTGLALVALPLIARLVPTALPMAAVPPLDWRMLAIALITSALTGLGFGLVPAWRAASASGAAGLQEGGRIGASRRTERLKSILVVAEVAATIALLVAAGLLLRALWRVQDRNPGFNSSGVITMRTTLPLPKYGATERRTQFYRDVLAGVQALPGVTGAAYISFLPMVMGGGIWPVLMAPGQDPSTAQLASLRFVTPGFFAAAGIPIREGRDVAETDTATAPAVAVVSQSFVRRYWPGADPIGRRFTFGLQERTIAGVVGDIRVRGLERDSEPQVYLPYQQVPDNSLVFYIPKDLIVRTASGSGALVPSIRRIVARADPQLPVSDVRTLEDIVQSDTSARTAQVAVLSGFAAMAFLLAGIGIHGQLSFGVSQRVRELAVRVALGAERHDVLRLVLADALRCGAFGTILGLPLAYAAARSMQALLAGLEPADLRTFAAAAATVLVMTLLGSVLPAWRALRIDPATAMRN